MKIKRVVANIETPEVDKADTFYHDVLGLVRVMDHGWLRTYGSDLKMTVQVSFACRGRIWSTRSGFVYRSRRH
jgi:catechol 2,3-dioxygenase-like lactoylglutathione lyase family enzyme